MCYSIKGKSTIVTGAASGVGLEIARYFVESGANVIAADRNGAGLREAFGKRPPHGSIFFIGDLRHKLTRYNLMSAVNSEFGRLDVLVNASREWKRPTSREPADDYLDTMLNQNFRLQFNMSQLAARTFINQAESDGGGKNRTADATGAIGSIINLSSIASQRTRPELLEFSISSAALDQATRSLAVSFAKHSIRVNSVAYGTLHKPNLTNVLVDLGANSDRESSQSEIKRSIPAGRLVEAKEIAHLVRFLASDSTPLLTGQVITIDGGRTLLDSSTALRP